MIFDRYLLLFSIIMLKSGILTDFWGEKDNGARCLGKKDWSLGSKFALKELRPLYV
jgi:hypothetical protein